MRYFGGAALVFACTASLGDAPLTPAQDDAPVIATLRFNDRELTMRATGQGVRYELLDESGSWHPGLTLEELGLRDPDLYDLMRSAMACRGSGCDAGTTLLDARLDPAPVLDASRTWPAQPRR